MKTILKRLTLVFIILAISANIIISKNNIELSPLLRDVLLFFNFIAISGGFYFTMEFLNNIVKWSNENRNKIFEELEEEKKGNTKENLI